MYGKLFDSMFEGTLYGHWEAIVTLQQMIILCTPEGVLDMTPQALSARTSIPLEIIIKGLKILSEPDPYTRTPGEEGRRITLIDEHRPWGWQIINHGKYSRMRDMDQKREADRVRIAEKRIKNKSVASVSQTVANVAHSDSDSDSNIITKGFEVSQDINKPVDNLPSKPKPVEVERVNVKPEPEKPPATPSFTVQCLTLATSLHKLGVAVTAQHTVLRKWVSEGFTHEQLNEAVELARQRKPEPETISAGYLDTIVRRAKAIA